MDKYKTFLIIIIFYSQKVLMHMTQVEIQVVKPDLCIYRKTEDSRIKIVDTIEDEFAWRKYGQKEILDAKFPRYVPA